MSDVINVLLVASDPLSVALVGEAFEEMAEQRFRRGWRNFALTLADGIEEAGEFLGKHGADAVLLSLAANSEALPAFQRIQSAAPATPVIVLTEPATEQLALDLVRAGAQDYLVIDELDCIPLAHAIRCSILRGRLQEARERGAMMDGATGLYNARGFDHLSECYAKLAERHGLHMLRVEAGLPGNSDDDWTTLGAADAFRSAFEPTDILARTGPVNFSAVAIVAGAEEAAATMSRLHAKLPKGTNLHAATF